MIRGSNVIGVMRKAFGEAFKESVCKLRTRRLRNGNTREANTTALRAWTVE
jgi:hypothetical protein